MVFCFVSQCKHYSHKHKCRFMSFPRDPHQVKRWAHLMRRGDRTPSVHARVCSCHFKDGKKENGPTIFAWNASKTFEPHSPERRLSLGPDDPSAYLVLIVPQPIVSCKNEPVSEDEATGSYHNESVSEDEATGSYHNESVSEDEATGSYHNESVSEDEATGSYHNESVSEDMATGSYHNESVSEDVATSSYHNESVSEDVATISYHNESVSEDVATSSYHNESVSKDVATSSYHNESVSEDVATSSYHNESVSEDVATSSYHNVSVSEDVATSSYHNESVSKDVATSSCHNESVSKDVATSPYHKSDSCQLSHTLPATVEAELYFLRQEVEDLKRKLKGAEQKFSLKLVIENDKKVKMYTGLPSASALKTIFYLLKEVKEVNYCRRWNVTKYTREEQIFITLMKLRMNLPHYDLAVRWDCSEAMISNIFLTWLNILHCEIYKKIMGTVPTQRKNQSCSPVCFVPFTTCRMILDRTEMSREEPGELERRNKCLSKYQEKSTFKGLVGVAPNGHVTFLSDLYPGSTSDKQIIQNSSVINVFQPGDLILADKEFLIRDLFPQGASVNIPPFLTTTQSTPERVQKPEIARARAHVERAIGRIKMYKILDLIPATLTPFSSKVWQVCGALTNFHNPLIKEVEGSMDCEGNSGSSHESDEQEI